MTTLQLVSAFFLFGTTFWLGLYLFVHAPREWYARLGGLAHLVFAFGVAFIILGRYAPAIELALFYARYGFVAVILTSLCLLAGLFLLAPGFAAWQKRWAEQPSSLILAWSGMVLYAVCLGILVFVDAWRFTAVFIAGIALLMIGIPFVIIHAADAGEAWAPHFFRSFDYALFMALLFGGQVVLLMAVFFGVNYPFLLLLLGMIVTAVLIQLFSNPVQMAVDQLALATFPKIRQARSHLRTEADVVLRVDPALNLMEMEANIFAKHTRRALSHMGDLPKLAVNPLNYLPIVENRLQENGRTESTLLRATELKIVLTESIACLRPPGEACFGTSDAWRHYNALYFPYVRGIRPYRRRYNFDSNGNDPVVQEALTWFREQVPERTLYNWQNAAANLIARDLRERSRQTGH